MSLVQLHRLVLAGIFCLTCGLSAGEVAPPPVGADAEKIKALIQSLGAPDNLKREEAERELLKIGIPALPLLKEAVKAPELETALRAKKLVSKLTERASRPAQSYAEVLPVTSIFMLEAANARQTLDKLKTSPLGRFWDLAESQKFYKGHHEAQVPNDQKVLDAVRELPKLADGRALFALGDPATAEVAELDPPLIYLLETKNGAALERVVRSLFEGLSDAPRNTRQYGPFTIEEHITAQSVFGQESVIHSLTQAGVEAFLNNILKRPERPLTTVLAEVSALLPNADFTYHLTRDGFNELADAGQLIDADQVKMVDTLGFLHGSSIRGVVGVTNDGFEEHMLFTIGSADKAGAEKNEGIFNVLRQLQPPVPDPQLGDALDMIPWQAAMLVSVNGDISKSAAVLGSAIRSWDALTAPPTPKPEIKPQETAVKPNPNQVKPAIPAPPPPVRPPNANPNPNPNPAPNATPPVDPNKKSESKSLGKEALEAGGGAPVVKPKEDKPGVQAAQAGDEKKAPPAAPVYPHLQRFEKMGLKLDQLLEQITGSMQIALFLTNIEGDTAPDYAPVVPLFAMVLKDPKGVEQALEAAAAGANPRFVREALNGGTHYIDKQADPDLKSGFWLKGNHLAYSSDRMVLELAGLALLHKNGNERMADRASYKQALATKRIGAGSLFTLFGDADQVLEVPYKLARIAWQEDDQNPWPSYEQIRPLLQNKPLAIDLKATPTGYRIDAMTPLTIFGMLEAFRRPLKEAGY